MNIHGNDPFLYFKSADTIAGPSFPIILPNEWWTEGGGGTSEVDVVLLEKVEVVEVEVGRVGLGYYCSIASFWARVVLYSSMRLLVQAKFTGEDTACSIISRVCTFSQ